MTVRKIQRDFLQADKTALSSLLANTTEEDVLTAFSLQERLDDVDAQVREMDASPEPAGASAALFFGGDPVEASRGIESEFGANAINTFQDLVSKVHADDAGRLGQRGFVPNRTASALHITNIARGSFGFILEELEPQGSLVESSLNAAVRHTTSILDAFTSEDEEQFRSSVADVDQRVLSGAQAFFNLLGKRKATLRLVAGSADHSFTSASIARAVERASSTIMVQDNDTLEGQLIGYLPEARQFEFRLDDGNVIRGAISKEVQIDSISLFNFVRAIIKVSVKRVYRADELARETYVMNEIQPAGQSPPFSGG